MGILHVFLALLVGGHWITGSVVDLTVRSGKNITLYCDCETSTEEYIVWYRNCTHENQPPLVLKLKEDPWKQMSDRATSVNSLPRFHFVKSRFSGSYDLLITNISDSDEGLYYCGTEKEHLVDGASINKYVHRYGSMTTRILINSPYASPCPDSHPRPESSPTPVYSGTCGSSVAPLIMMFASGFFFLISFFSFIFIYRFCQKTEKGLRIYRPDNNGQRRQNQDEDLCLTQVWFR